MDKLTGTLFNESEEYLDSLSPSSAKSVKVLCPECGKERVLRFYKVKENGHTYCRGCSNKKRAFDDMIGQKYGRLTILSYTQTREIGGNKSTYFNATCDCGNTLEVSASHVKSGHTRSCSCYFMDMLQGENNPNYNSELSIEERNSRRGYIIQRWGNMVKRRDGFICQVCGSTEKLVAHHLNGFKSDKEGRYDVENGVTLCRDCHTDFHVNFMGNFRTPCTEDDFLCYRQQM